MGGGREEMGREEAQRTKYEKWMSEDERMLTKTEVGWTGLEGPRDMP